MLYALCCSAAYPEGGDGSGDGGDGSGDGSGGDGGGDGSQAEHIARNAFVRVRPMVQVDLVPNGRATRQCLPLTPEDAFSRKPYASH